MAGGDEEECRPCAFLQTSRYVLLANQMAHKKAGGTAKNLTSSNPQYLGVKLYAGEKAGVGSVIVRQRGTVFLPGKNVSVGKDHTLFANKSGVVSFKNKRKVKYDGRMTVRKEVSVT